MESLIRYFAERHLFANIGFFIVFAGGLLFWQWTGKEELPEMTLDFVRISVSYPGASASEVENSVTWRIENELRSLDGIVKIESTSSQGVSSISVELEKNSSNRDQVISDIRSTVMGVTLPAEVINLPTIREFRTSRKAVIDVGMYLDGVEFPNDEERRELQNRFHSLEKKLLSLPEVSRVSKSGYLSQEFQIQLHPDELYKYRVSIGNIIQSMNRAAVRQPAGSLESLDRSRVTLYGQMDRIPEFLETPVQGSFSGRIIRMKDVATVKDTFERKENILKINGYEGVMMNVSKSSATGILDAVDRIRQEIDLFQKSLDINSRVRVVLMDDESTDVRNRIGLIASNGILGFILILAMLFLLLNFQSGIWVALGIPFTLSFTMVAASLMGYTINNITLSAVIIVMGMVVDDAIVVSENIMRLKSQGVPSFQAAVEGTSAVLLPISASIFTTMAAFFPLSLFEGRLSMLTESIPPIVSLMLIASLLESVFMLPAHLNQKIPRSVRLIFSLGTLPFIEQYFFNKESRRDTHNTDNAHPDGHWFFHVEDAFQKRLFWLLKYRITIITAITLLMFFSGVLLVKGMRFTLFPREEAREISIMGETPDGSNMYFTAEKTHEIESIFREYMGSDVVGYLTQIRQSRYRSSTAENAFMVRVELVPKELRKKSLNQLTEEWQNRLDALTGYKKLQISRMRFGPGSGVPVEIVVQQNNTELRDRLVAELADILKSTPGIKSVETGEALRTPEYRIRPDRNLMERVGVSLSSVGEALRTGLEGTVLYRLIEDDELKNVRLTVPHSDKLSIGRVLETPVSNSGDYLIPLGNLVKLVKENQPSEIKRLNLQRMVMLYVDQDAAVRTPLETASYLEKEVFPGLIAKYPGTLFSFEGEIRFSRESSSFFPLSVAMILFLIYTILALQFNSLIRPITVLLSIPPAVAAVIFIFALHGAWTFGFFGVIGVMGLSGVIINDSIVLLNSLDTRYAGFTNRESSNQQISTISASRLRAVTLTTVTTVAGLFPTAYGILGYDSMLAEMMLALAWGILFGTIIILVFIPALYSLEKEFIHYFRGRFGGENP